MNKKRSFLLFNTIIVALILTINNYLLSHIQSFEFTYSIVFVLIISVSLYITLSKPLIDDIFNIDNNLKQKIEKTMHELNTPVSTIQINSEILSSKIDDIKNQERLNKIDKACVNLIRLYEDMEYYIKKEIEAVQIVSFDLLKSIHHCIKKHDDLITQETKKIAIDIDVKSTIIVSDKNGFEIVLDNLISNAIKHNKTISAITISLKDNILYFSDDGEGIKSQNIYKVFDKYYQIDKKTRGFGIGLNIVKEFCDKHKIDIKINSSTKGTTFSLNLQNIIEKDLT
jgi:signal transduction histidine kinase